MRLSTIDLLSLVFLGGLLAVGAACGTAHLDVAAILVALAGVVVGAAWWGPRSAVGAVVHGFSPVLVIPVMFNTIAAVGDCVNPGRWDGVFAAADAVAFTGIVVAWREALGRPWWLTDIAYFFYVSYYVLPIAVAAVLYRRQRRARFEEFVLNMVVCFYLSYIGYIIFPTLGPRVPLEMEEAVLGGGSLSRGVRAFLYFAEYTRTDAFPSGHTAIALVCLYQVWRFLPRLRMAVLAWVIGIVFPTIYLYYHYLVDLIAGVALAAVTPACAFAVQRLLEPQGARQWLADFRSYER